MVVYRAAFRDSCPFVFFGLVNANFLLPLRRAAVLPCPLPFLIFTFRSE